MSWTTTRSFTSFVWGLVPLLVATSVVALVIVWPFVELKSARRVHREYTINAEASGEFKAALLGSKRVQLLTNEPQWQFLHGMTMRQAGLVENANVLMRGLATFAKDCYPPAHMYLAGLYYEQFDKDNTKVAELEKALAHVKQVIAVEPNSLQAIVYVGKIQLKLGRTDEAMEIFKRISGDDPTIVPDLAKYLLERGESEAARFHIQRGLATLREYAEKSPDDRLVWNTMFEILIVEEDYAKTIDEFTKAVATVESPQVKAQLRMLQSNVMIEFSKQFENDVSVDGLRRRLAIISQAVAFFPRNPVALQKFVDLILYTKNPEYEVWLSDEARHVIVPGIFHLICGIRHAVDGRPDDARKQFRLSLGGNPAAAVIVTDVARILANSQQKPEDGLLLINSAVDTWSNPALNFARGDVLMNLGRNAEALTELEYASEIIANDPFVFDILAKCRDALGDVPGADVARKRAEEVRMEQIAKSVEGSITKSP